MDRAVLISLALVASCVRAGGSFHCTGDFDCILDGVSGQCEPVGYCSFPDALCDGSYRFGTHSGAYSGDCVTPQSSGYVTIGGSVTGLLGSNLVLRNNGTDDLLITEPGPFTFETSLLDGVPYEVSVAAQPLNPSQTCSVGMGTGVTDSVDVTDVAVTCETTSYTIGGTLVGLAGSQITVSLNGSSDLTLSSNGAFTFPASIASGQSFTVAIKTQPGDHVCDVSGATGIVGAANVSTVVVNCAAGAYTIGGIVSGLEGTATLRNNDADTVTITANGAFAFATPLTPGSSYNVTVQQQPLYPPRNQVCTVAMGAGTVASSNVASIAVTCATSTFTVGGSVSGLAGTLVLENNGGDTLTVSQNGPFTFATPIASASTYNAKIVTQPSGQICTMSMPSGTVTNANVTLSIACTTTSDPGILCGAAVYCAPDAGQQCCIDHGTPSCQTGCGASTPIRCDTQADCTADGNSESVCCGNVDGDTFKGSYCTSPSKCNPPHAFYCDPNVATPCPSGGTCMPTTVPLPGYYRCF
jgi:hypothetical protein